MAISSVFTRALAEDTLGMWSKKAASPKMPCSTMVMVFSIPFSELKKTFTRPFLMQ